MGLLSGIAKTISGVSKTALGSVSKVRSVMNLNPSLVGLAFPPQVSAGLGIAKVVGGLVGIKVPTEKDILGFATGKLDQVLGGIRAKAKTPLDQFEAALKLGTDKLTYAQKIFSQTQDFKGLTAEQILDKITWLL